MNLHETLRETLGGLVEAEAAAIEHYISGLENDIPRSDIILAMKIHLVMLKARAAELQPAGEKA